MIKVTLSLFLIGHFLADFYLQINKRAENKKKTREKLIRHGLIYLSAMILIMIPILSLSFLKWVIAVSLVHFMVDWWTLYWNKKDRLNDKNKMHLYVLKQIIYLVTILIVTMVISLSSETMQYTNLFKRLSDSLYLDIELILTWLLAIIIIIKPVSITIKKFLCQYQPATVDKEEDGHLGAGTLIGILERLIILILLSQNQYAVIGFVLTAKSIARYNKIVEDPQFSEYYLLGTLLSILLVIVTHMLLIL